MAIDVNAVAKAAGANIDNYITSSGVNASNKTAFDKLLDSAYNMILETDSYQKDAQQAEINFEMGYSDNTNELAIAQQKANISLQYTVAVRDKLVEAYKEIMQMTV
ncbi:MAG: flagellar hook-basal body complex protein FliE [Lachnospiraceae bacterium]|nr:flagellar hook-basal body complex protein FliE [Lachnospiraceae bacterium]